MKKVNNCDGKMELKIEAASRMGYGTWKLDHYHSTKNKTLEHAKEHLKIIRETKSRDQVWHSMNLRLKTCS